jgi:uncharacterized protein (TIGR00725 family)
VTHARRPIIGVMGGAECTPETARLAYDVGRRIAEKGWVLLNGGRAAGVMDASAKGAREAGGLVVGVLPDRDLSRMSPYVDIPIRTGMGDARNGINILSSDVVVALKGSAGTLSEIALAIRNGKPLVLVGWDLADLAADHERRGLLARATTAEEAVARVEAFLR